MNSIELYDDLYNSVYRKYIFRQNPWLQGQVISAKYWSTRLSPVCEFSVNVLMNRNEGKAAQIFKDHTDLRADSITDFIAAFDQRFQKRSA